VSERLHRHDEGITFVSVSNGSNWHRLIEKVYDRTDAIPITICQWTSAEKASTDRIT